MSVNTKLLIPTLIDPEVDVLEFDYTYYRSTDKKGVPTGLAVDTIFYFTLEAASKTEFFGRLIRATGRSDSSSSPFNATIIMRKNDDGSVLRSIEMQNAHVVDFAEYYDIDANTAAGKPTMTYKIGVVAQVVVNGDTQYHADWGISQN